MLVTDWIKKKIESLFVFLNDFKNKEDVKPADVLPEENDMDFVEESKRALIEEFSKKSNSLLYGVVIFMLIALIWGHFAILDEVTSAKGKVIPSSQVQVIQSLEGGILSKIYVQEGDKIKKGTVLLHIDDTQFTSNYQEQFSKYLTLLAETSRLQTEATGDETIQFPEEVSQNAPDLVNRETALFDSQMKELKGNLDNLQKSYDIANKQLAITKPLVEQGLMSQLDLLKLEGMVNDNKGKLDNELQTFHAKAHEQLTNTQAQLSSIQASLSALKDKVVRTEVRSPVDGVVKKINIATIGGVIKPGMDIMEIVPTEDTLLIEAEVKPSDIAFIYPGQKAIVKFTAYDFSKYGGLDGVVKYISADTIEETASNGDKVVFYKILVRTDKSYLGTNENQLNIIPGMVVTVDILTGKKSVLEYLVTPFLRAKENALSER